MKIELESRQVDRKRRLLMPPECPPRSAVTIQRLDQETWLVKRHRPSQNFKLVLIPVIDKLPDDPEWEKKEAALARYAASQLPEPEP